MLAHGKHICRDAGHAVEYSGMFSVVEPHFPAGHDAHVIERNLPFQMKVKSYVSLIDYIALDFYYG